MVKTQLSASDEHQVHGAKSEIIYVRTNATSKTDSDLFTGPLVRSTIHDYLYYVQGLVEFGISL